MRIVAQSLFFLFSVFLLLFNNVAGSSDYNELRWVRVYIENQDQLQGIKGLDLDVWSAGSNLIIGPNDILMRDENILDCWDWGMSLEILLFEVETGLEREGQEMGIVPEFGSVGFGEEWFNSYHNFDDIITFLNVYTEDHPDIVTYASIGTTYENRDIPVVTVTGPHNPNSLDDDKLKIIVIGGLQGREWISPATVLYVFKKLVESYSKDSAISSFLDKVSISFIPLSNPDGYDYSWTTERLWKKNRFPNSDGSFGIDLNRNFDSQWGCSEISPKSNLYCGPSVFSELETQAIKNFVEQNGPFSAALDFTGYSQGILRPYSHTESVPSRDSLLQLISEKWVKTIKENSRGADYKIQNAFSVFNVTGNVRDWMFDNARVPLSFTVQLRDKGTFGFLVPPSQILISGIEHFAGFKAFIQSVISH